MKYIGDNSHDFLVGGRLDTLKKVSNQNGRENSLKKTIPSNSDGI